MKINVKNGFLAVLSEESGEVVALFGSNQDAKDIMEKAICEHFDCHCSILSTNKDFDMPFDYEQFYEVSLNLSEDNQETVTLIMTYAPIY